MKVLSVVGARPNFVKIAPIVTELNRRGIENLIVHTGQHYDQGMSREFFDDLGLPTPDINLGVGSGTHTVQTANIMRAFEDVLFREQPDVMIVVGDVNSTLACSVVASKIEYSGGHKDRSVGSRERPVICHVEAGLRSFDRSMPEEINRIVTDALSDILFVTEESGRINLLNEGKTVSQIHFVGNVMIDTLLKHKELARYFLAYLASKDYNMQIVKDADALPPNPEYVKLEEFLRPAEYPNERGCHEAFSKASEEIAIGGSYSPFVLPQVASRIEDEFVGGFMSGIYSVEKALQMVETQINEEIQRTLNKNPTLRQKYDELVALQKKIDQCVYRWGSSDIRWANVRWHD